MLAELSLGHVFSASDPGAVASEQVRVVVATPAGAADNLADRPAAQEEKKKGGCCSIL